MSGFNTSTRKEDISVRLRAQNLKLARDQTKRLEEDNRKMEERLRELKTAMNREKEDRERKGTGFWSKGQTNAGSLTSYASEVLLSKPNNLPKDGKKKKIKILQDEPIEVPKRSSQPGTMKHIAQRKLATGAAAREKGLKCGQCEDRTATLTCVQCSEIYCFGCFSAFHLKGALKQHRSVPLSATGPRICMSPRTNTDPHSPSGSQASGSVPACSVSFSGESGAAQASPSAGDPALLRGDYDESQSAASFQQALMAWRQGDQPKAFQPTVSPSKRIASPVKSPVFTLDESTGTADPHNVPEIKFKSTLSYADRLMLKKHRRTELAEYPTPRLGSSKDNSQSKGNSSLQGSRSRFSDTFSVGHHEIDRGRSQIGNGREGSFIDDGERVDFQSLFEAVTSSDSPDHNTGGSSYRNITPSSSNSSVLSVDESTTSSAKTMSTVASENSSKLYVVQEVSDLECWQLQHNIDSKSTSRVQANGKVNKPKSSSTKRNSMIQESVSELFPSGNSSPIPSVSETSTSRKNINTKKWKSDESKSKAQKENSDLVISAVLLGGDDSSTDLSARSKSSRSRVGTSRAKPRPISRAESRAVSNMGLKGILTKTPSDALKHVAHMVQSSTTYQSPMEDFFLVGVEPSHQQPTSTRLTPSKQVRHDQRPKSRAGKDVISVSNRLYQMAPRSWRPESSLGETVPLSDVKFEMTEEMTLAYSYSGQIGGQATEWRPSSSQSRVQIPPGDIDPKSSLVFGDEMFINEAAAISGSIKAPRAPSTQRNHTTFKRSTQLDRGDSATVKSQAPRNATAPLAKPLGRHKIPNRDSLGTPKNSRDSTPINSRDSTPKNSLDATNDDYVDKHKPASRQHRVIASELKSDQLLGPSPSKNIPALVTRDKKTQESSHSKSSDNAAYKPVLSRQSNQSSTVSNRDLSATRAGPNFKPSLSKYKKEQITQQAAHNSKSDITQGRPVAIQGLKKGVTRSSQPYESTSARPISSTNLPLGSKVQHTQPVKGRPNSSTGGQEPLKKGMISSKSVDTNLYSDTLISDIMMSRVQEDGWVADDVPNDSDSGDDMSFDYDDGDAITPNFLRSQQMRLMSQPPEQGNQHWETDVRPFSGVSLTSKGGNNTPAGGRGDNKSKRPTSSRPLSMMSGRESRAIVIDGDDLSCYDEFGLTEQQDMEDKQALDQLEWELASDTGRLTADGNVSRMSLLDETGETNGQFSKPPVKLGKEKDYDIAAKLCEDERNAEKEVDALSTRRSMTLDEDEVRALR
ncbi:unnamed protein product [Lymnaea stagnalis]|uniref:B box-type domain-containing protein n=1 Tax=Lymnaea stagnalis TaxID=6523 RepID=A0AAV2HEM0_LYMST